jgi:8-oxo-dGTP diphosphatase
MSHIHTQPGQYDFTVSAYIIRLDGPEPALIMHMHKKLGKYLQFGGHVELDEDPWMAVEHEVLEESGYDLRQLRLLQPAVPLVKLTSANAHPFPVATLSVQFGDTDHYHTDIAYAFTAQSLPNQPIGDDESADIKLFTRGQLAALPDAEVPGNVRDIGLYIFDECLANWTPVAPEGFSV